MGSALAGVDVVGEGKYVFGVAIVPLHGDLDTDTILLALAVNDLRVNRALGAVKMLDEGQKAAFVEELMAFLRALVFDGNLHAAIEECQLTQPLRQNIETELAHLKDLGIRLEGHLRAALLRFPDLLQRRLRIAAPVTLLVDLTVALDFDFQSFRQRVDHGYADAVQPAGNFVGILVEFAAGVKFGQYHFGRGDLFSGVDIDRNAAPVVDDRDAVIDVNFDLNGIAMAGQRDTIQ